MPPSSRRVEVARGDGTAAGTAAGPDRVPDGLRLFGQQWIRQSRRVRFLHPWWIGLDHGALGMDPTPRIHGLLADRANRSGGDRNVPVLLGHDEGAFQEPGLRREGRAAWGRARPARAIR